MNVQIPWATLTSEIGFAITALTYVDCRQYRTEKKVVICLVGSQKPVELSGDMAEKFYDWYMQFTGQQQVLPVHGHLVT